MVSRLPSRFKGRMARWHKKHRPVSLARGSPPVTPPSPDEHGWCSPVIPECSQTPLTGPCCQDPSAGQVVLHKRALALAAFLSGLRSSKRQLCIKWKPDERKKKTEYWRSLVRDMLRLESQLASSRARTRRVMRARWVQLTLNAQRQFKIRECGRLRSEMDRVERWCDLVSLLDYCRLEHCLGRARFRARNYNRVRQAGNAVPFIITVLCANVGEIKCSVFAHEKVEVVIEHALSLVAFGSPCSRTSRQALFFMPQVKQMIGRPGSRGEWWCTTEGRPLQADSTLADTGVVAGATLRMHILVRGGGRPKHKGKILAAGGVAMIVATGGAAAPVVAAGVAAGALAYGLHAMTRTGNDDEEESRRGRATAESEWIDEGESEMTWIGRECGICKVVDHPCFTIHTLTMATPSQCLPLSQCAS